MAWSSPTDLFAAATQVTSAIVPITSDDANWGNAAGSNSNVITLNAGESCQIQIVGVAGSTVGDLQFRVLTSPDGGVKWDNITYMSGSLGAVTAALEYRRTITVYGVRTFKIQFAPSTAFAWTMMGAGAVAGTPTNATGAKCTYIKDGISA